MSSLDSIGTVYAVFKTMEIHKQEQFVHVQTSIVRGNRVKEQEHQPSSQ